jgi:peptide methionine sulfoxide reductase MsrA
MAVEQATLADGCFWRIEAVFERLKGAERVVSGYAGSSTPNPTYEQVCSGRTGHAEVTHMALISPKVNKLRESMPPCLSPESLPTQNT